jgi:hypothetical protein
MQNIPAVGIGSCQETNDRQDHLALPHSGEVGGWPSFKRKRIIVICRCSSLFCEEMGLKHALRGAILVPQGRSSTPLERFFKPIATGPSRVHFRRRTNMTAGRMNRKQRKELTRRLRSEGRSSIVVGSRPHFGYPNNAGGVFSGHENLSPPRESNSHHLSTTPVTGTGFLPTVSS